MANWHWRTGWILVLALAGAAHSAATTRPPDLGALVHTDITAVLDQLQKDGDFAAAKASLTNTFDRVIAFCPAKKPEPFREAAAALRLVTQLEQLPESRRMDLLKYLRANPELSSSLLFLMRDCNTPSRVFDLLDQLREQRAKQVATFPNLAAAICVVHDRPLSVRLNENTVKSPDALAIFDYYAKNESRMLLGIRQVPPELLLYIVDTTASIDEMNWALARYAGNRMVGQLYFAVKYDHNHVRTGATKRVTAAGYNLPNLLMFGGVCVDQAYFAAAVGKAIGLPTTIVVGSSAQAGHAWLGFFELAGGQGRWNFEIGRYDSYRGVQGHIVDPQTRKQVPETSVALLAEMGRTTPQSRQTARALVDAVRRLTELQTASQELKPRLPNSWAALATAAPRKAETKAQLELLELAVRQSPGDALCWEPLRELAAAGKLTLADKKHWSEILQSVCGPKYPDFVLSMLVPMVRTVDDTKEQDRLWNWLFELVRARPDLAAQVRMEQGAMWETAGQNDRAGACYMDVINRYANGGPFVIAALEKAEAAMQRAGQSARIPMLYETTWLRIQPPKQMAAQFATDSTWYKVGQLLAARLDSAGLKPKADMVRLRLQQAQAK